MARKPSAETELKRVKRELKVAMASRDSWRGLAEQLKQDKLGLNIRVNSLMEKVSEWEKRFDLLLASKGGEA